MKNECVFGGRSTVDLLYLIDGFPSEDTKVTASSFLSQAGGPALNAAITYAFLGGRAQLISEVGTSVWGAQIRKELLRYQVSLIDISKDENFVPPISSVIVNTASGSRTLLNVPAAEDVRGFHPFPSTQVGKAEMVLIDGFLTEQLSDFLNLQAAAGAIICLDGGSWKPSMLNILPLVSIAICSERFVAPGAANPEATIRFLLSKGIQRVALTRGAAEIVASEGGRTFSVQAPRAKAVDTLGAGDIFHGAFCWFFQQSSLFEAALREAAVVASFSCQFAGGREWMKHWDHRHH